MNKITKVLLCAVVFTAMSQCQLPQTTEATAELVSLPIESESVISEEAPEATSVRFEFAGNGKEKNAPALSSLYTFTDTRELPQVKSNAHFERGLKKQLKVLKYRRKQKLKNVGEVDVNVNRLITTIETLITNVEEDPSKQWDMLDAYQLKGEDGKGNVFFTGYFTPVLKVNRTKTEEYQYPIYGRPRNWEGKLPTRSQIDGEKVLADKGLELAYTKSPLDIYFMQIQGSGIIEYPDGKRESLAYAGSNGYAYRSIGKYMIDKGYATPADVSLKKIKKFFKVHPELINDILFINQSYVFFAPVPYQKTPKGAGLVSLTADYSIAVDTRYIPLGSCVLAAVPVINRKNRVTHHEYRVLLAQDIGGAIKGPGHVDLYTGVGDKGRRAASALHHYGQMWLLLAKDNNLTASL